MKKIRASKLAKFARSAAPFVASGALVLSSGAFAADPTTATELVTQMKTEGATVVPIVFGIIALTVGISVALFARRNANKGMRG